LEVLFEFYPAPVHRDTISEKTSYTRSSRDTYLQKLISKEIAVVVGPGTVVASKTLFD